MMRNLLGVLTLALLWANSLARSSSLLFKPHEPNVCPDGRGTCAPQTTCCELKDGGFGCCPIPEATCCSDSEHCCPKNYRCDVSAQQCLHDSSGEVVSWSKKVPAMSAPQEQISDAVSAGLVVGVIICPDKKSQCMDGQTCCQLTTGQWACCPLPQAVCCPDHAHCCPNSYTCDSAQTRCIKSTTETVVKGAPKVLPWLNYVPTKSGIVKCDKSFACQDGQTCCKVGSSYQCCPLPKAVCCSDGSHCCPSGYRCASATGVCLKNDDSSPIKWLSVNTVERAGNTVLGNGVKCDDQVSCPDGQTCCKMTSGMFGCCPMPRAVCCSDRIHCCPEGYTCNTAVGTCDLGPIHIPWSVKVPAIPTGSLSAVLPSEPKYTCSGEAWCKRGSTCCESSDGSLRGCCSEQNAVCCGDGVHCCPAGSSCDAASGVCRSVDSSLSFTWLMTRRVDGFGSLREIESAAGVLCPDKSSCSDDNTCCQVPSKQYACCPYAKGVCCSDQLHCCPKGMTCDVAHSRCVQDGFSLPWNLFSRNHAKLPAVLERDLKLTLSKDTCPDLTSVCPENSTCCLSQSGAYGCCPHKNAVCCSDKLHCCPYGTTCDTTKQACVPSTTSDNTDENKKKNNNNDDDDSTGDDFNDIPFPVMNPYRKFN